MNAVDFVVFGVIIGASAFIGIFYACRDRKNASVDNYFFAGKSMNLVAIGMSLLATYTSAVTLQSLPAEAYIVGTEFLWNAVTRVAAIIPATIYFIPAYRRLDMRSAYEFIEMRFNDRLRRTTSLFGLITMLFYTGLTVYVSATTLNAVTDLSTTWAIAITSVFCICYTWMGGIKAVVWTDATQVVFMLAGLLAILIKGIITVGGFENVFAAVERGERQTMFRFDFGFISRVSPQARILGGFGQYLYTFAISQQAIQRYQSCKSTSQARWASILNMTVGCVQALCLGGVGFVAYALFETCDPVKWGTIQDVDQIVPYMAVYLLSDIPGLVGLYVAAIFSAALSTVSSTINSQAIVVVEDFVCPFWKRVKKSDRLKLYLGRIVVVILGVVIMAIAFVASFSESNILQLLNSFTGIMTGPLIGIYMLGFFCPRANSTGAATGFVLSLAFGLFLFIGKEFFKIPYLSSVPPTSVSECPTNNITTFTTTAVLTSNNISVDFSAANEFTTAKTEVQHSAFQDLLNLHFNMLVVIGILQTLILGYLFTLITGPRDPTTIDPKLFIPLMDNKHLPKSVITFFRFGVLDEEEWEKKVETSTIILEDKL